MNICVMATLCLAATFALWRGRLALPDALFASIAIMMVFENYNAIVRVIPILMLLVAYLPQIRPREVLLLALLTLVCYAALSFDVAPGSITNVHVLVSLCLWPTPPSFSPAIDIGRRPLTQAPPIGP